MSLQRLPSIACDACTTNEPRRHIGDSWMTAEDVRHEAARKGWVRRGRRDLCPYCSGWCDDRTCPICGRDYICSHDDICPRCTGEALPDLPQTRTTDDAYRAELRAAGMLG
jgi:RecJ-like exonuclease